MKIKAELTAVSIFLLSLSGCSPKTQSDIPQTMRDTIVTDYFGTIVADPYRWLENKNSPKVKEWIQEQNDYTDKILSAFPEGEPLEKRIEELSATSVQLTSPDLVNGKLFFMQFTPPQAQPVVAYKTWPEGQTEVLIDPNKSTANEAITGFWPSPSGNYLAYGTAIGGNEATTIRIMNVKTGKVLADTLPDAGGGATPVGMVWDADENGLTYVRLPLPGTVPESESQFYAALYHHQLDRPATEDSLVFGKNLSKVAEYSFIRSDDGKHAAMFVHFGDGNPNYVYIRKSTYEWKQVLDTSANVRVAAEINHGAAWAGDNLLVISYENAPQGKLLSVAPDGTSTELVSEDNWGMNSVYAVKGGFLLVDVNGPYWKVEHYDNLGRIMRIVDLPKSGIGVGTIASSSESDQALITFSGWTMPETWDQYNTTDGTLKTVFRVTPSADYSDVEFRVIGAVSKDGTRIPVTVLYKKGTKKDGVRPTIVYGYGGFGITTAPHFIGAYLAWIENGGVLAYANIRGGGEEGEGWHEAGMLAKKQNVFDDMYAAAEVMIKNNWTDSLHLGILGGSNGGLLMGAELTQHPASFKAVVSFVGIYDMLRAELFPNGQYNISEYGTSTQEPDFKWMYAYSPYHNIKPDTRYPAILLETGINDPRVASWQSWKFAAALQAANSSDNPILLLTRGNEGHGVTATFSQRLGNLAASLTFFAHELGLKVK